MVYDFYKKVYAKLIGVNLMKKLFLETSFSKIYMLGVILISLLILGGYFSYAMFTVSKEKSNAVSIVTGNLEYNLQVDGEESNVLSVPANTTEEFSVTLSNPNNRVARFNFYYVGSLPSDVTAGYVVDEGLNIPPVAAGTNLEKSGSSGSSNTYTIKVSNNSNSSVTITLGVGVGLDYNDLSLPSNGHLFEEAKLSGPVADIVLENIGDNGSTNDDDVDTFITGEDPNNYIWYSGKLWRAVSVNNEAKTTKLVTQWNISAIPYNASDNTAFEGSHMEMWLNDTSVDGFLGNLRDYEKFIVTDAVWDATLDATSLGSIQRPNGTTTVTDAVGLLNMYEYQSSYYGTTYSNGYLNNGLYWWTLTPYSSSRVRRVYNNGRADNGSPSSAYGVRPSINLKSSIKIVGGDGTEANPYRLEGDNDTNLSGTMLNTRYSGEYITFGTGENTLYRIVSHETSGLTKITSAEPLKSGGSFIKNALGNYLYSSTTTMGTFLNGTYLTDYVGSSYSSMIEDSTTWYLGAVDDGVNYRLGKYTDTNMSSLTSPTTNATVGLLRMGELMSGQFERDTVKGGSSSTGLTTSYWTLTPYSASNVRLVFYDGIANNYSPSNARGVRPSVNLKSNVVITGGTGTKQDPFMIAE